MWAGEKREGGAATLCLRAVKLLMIAHKSLQGAPEEPGAAACRRRRRQPPVACRLAAWADGWPLPLSMRPIIPALADHAAPAPLPGATGAAAVAGGRPRCKLVLLGDGGVGKSALVQQQCRGTFNPDMAVTVGAAFLAHTLSLPSGVSVKFEIWWVEFGCMFGSRSGPPGEHVAAGQGCTF